VGDEPYGGQALYFSLVARFGALPAGITQSLCFWPGRVLSADMRRELLGALLFELTFHLV
jgi:hypothetical protein